MDLFMKHYKKILPAVLALILIISMCVVGSLAPNASGTGVGLAEWAMKAYKEEWKYVYGGETPGEVDCSGLIYSYCGGERGGTAQLNSATESGNVSDGIPNIHGLGLYQPGHVGVYVGNGMAVDARDEESNVCYQSTATKSWTKWFKIAAVSYPDNGWEKFSGNYYYYENGEYIVSTSRMINGKEYTFSEDGTSDIAPDIEDDSKAAENSDKEKTAETIGDATLKDTIEGDVTPGESGEDVKTLQQQLKKLKYFNEECTGYYGEITKNAVIKFQKDNSITESGFVGTITQDKLFGPKAKINPKYKSPEKSEKSVKKTTAVKKSQPVVKSKTAAVSADVKKDVKSGINAAGKVVAKTYSVSREALAAGTAARKVSSISATEENNSNFLVWMAVVLAIAAFASGTVFILNHRRKKVYTGTRVRTTKKTNATVRYW